MLVNLPNGKTIDIPVEEYLRMGQEGYQYYIAQNVGYYMEHPFSGSAMYNKSNDDDDDDFEIDDEDELDDDDIIIEDYDE